MQNELKALKEAYERELVMAQAKVEVINDLLARFTPVEETAVSEVDFADETVETPATDNIY